MKSSRNEEELPVGFSMALAQNPDAMDVFAGLTKEQRQQVVAKTHHIHSKQEMRSYVDSLVGLGLATPPIRS